MNTAISWFEPLSSRYSENPGYKNLRKNIDTNLKKVGITEGFVTNEDYHDCVIAKLLLKKGHRQDTVEAVLNEFYTEDRKVRNQSIVMNAVLSIKYEQAIMAFNIPESLQTRVFISKSFKDIEKDGITVRDIYYTYIRERMQLNPSIGENLVHEAVDRDAVEFFLNAFDDLDKETLVEALSAASPRAFMAGMDRDYIKDLVDEVGERVKAYKERDKDFADLIKEYNLQHGLAMEGISIDNQSMTEYQDGYIATKMLKRNYPFFDVRNAILSNHQNISIDKAQEYVDGIMSKAEEVIRREEVLADYLQRTDIDAVLDDVPSHEIDECYRSFLGKMYRKKGFMQSSMDIRAAAMCLAYGFKEDAIRQQVIQFSPVAAEAGRDENYVDYCMAIAREKLRKEREKLDRLLLVPHRKDERSIEEEYEFLHYEVEKAVDLPWEMTMDVKIATSLLDQGYVVLDMENVIDKAKIHGFKKNPDYAKKVLAQAQQKVNKIVEFRDLSAGQKKQLERTIEFKDDNKKGKERNGNKSNN